MENRLKLLSSGSLTIQNYFLKIKNFYQQNKILSSPVPAWPYWEFRRFPKDLLDICIRIFNFWAFNQWVVKRPRMAFSSQFLSVNIFKQTYVYQLLRQIPINSSYFVGTQSKALWHSQKCEAILLECCLYNAIHFSRILLTPAANIFVLVVSFLN